MMRTINMLMMQTRSGGDPVAVFLVLVLIFGGVAFYFLPTIIAAVSKHRQLAAISILNLLAGWTFIGWIVAIVWAFVESQPQRVVYVERPSQPQYYPEPQPPQQTRSPPDYNYKKIQ